MKFIFAFIVGLQIDLAGQEGVDDEVAIGDAVSMLKVPSKKDIKLPDEDKDVIKVTPPKTKA